ncbi:MAG: hypothetical protein IKE76_12555 [Clostridia bacterium]|nr:hypothetical protein [Clostridia bacterium]
MAIIHSCYGMHCPWENSRGECRWKKGNPFPCEVAEMNDEERERAEYDMEKDYEEDGDE